jgi:hypothetical protein
MIKKLLCVLLLSFFMLDNSLIQASAPTKSLLPPDDTAKPLSGVASNDEKLYTSSQLSVSNLYPNPADNYVEIDYTLQDANADARITIRNVLGLVVGEYGLVPNGSKLHIDTSHLSAGVYFYTLSLHSKNVVTKKLLIRN